MVRIARRDFSTLSTLAGSAICLNGYVLGGSFNLCPVLPVSFTTKVIGC